MSTAGFAGVRPIFQDEVISATALNRSSGAILDRARTAPVTIMRNDEGFALLRREEAHRMAEVAAYSGAAISLVSTAMTALIGKSPAKDNPFEWVGAFKGEDLRSLATEIAEALSAAQSMESSWLDFEATVHEWQETAIAIRSKIHSNAANAESDPIQINHPDAAAVLSA